MATDDLHDGPTARNAGVRRRAALVALVVIAAVVIAFQVKYGAYRQEMTLDPDEPAHFVSGLVVHDYLAHGLGASPMAYAREYFAHYPKVAIGNWPPGFYAMQGVWTLLFPESYRSVIVLMAVLAAAIAWMTYVLLRDSLPQRYAVLGAAAFLALPPVCAYFSFVMAEIPLTLVSTMAVCVWMQFLRHQRARDLFLFGVLAVLAVLTKYNGLFLFLLPPLSIVIGGHWRLLGKPVIWRSVLAVLIVTVPWILYYLPVMRSGWPDPDRWFVSISNTLFFYPRVFWEVVGAASLATAAIGAAVRLRDRAWLRTEAGAPYLVAASAFLSALLFHMAVPGGLFAVRHMIPAFPFFAMFFAAGTYAIADALERTTRQRHAGWVVVAGIVALLAFRPHSIRTFALDGFGSAADAVLADARGQAVVALVASDSPGEGSFVAHVAVRDPARPTHTVWRGSKLLASAEWSGSDYRLRTDSEAGVLALLDSAGVSAVVLDESVRGLAHQGLLRRVVTMHPERFALTATIPIRRDDVVHAVGVRIYRFVHDSSRASRTFLRQTPGRPGTEIIRAAAASR